MPFIKLIQPHTKAIAGFITFIIVTPLTTLGISAETPIETAILILVNAALVSTGIWFSPKNK